MLSQVTFPSSEDLLQGYFFPSVKGLHPVTLIFLQGFPGSPGDELVCERLAEAGCNVLTFNYRGTFESEGTFSFCNAVDDIDAALRFVLSDNFPGRTGPASIILGGWSFGSGLLPAGAARHPEIRRLVLLSGRDFTREAHRIEADVEYAKTVKINLEGVRKPRGPVTFREDILEDLVRNREIFDLEELAPRLANRDILLLGAREDEVSAATEYLLPFQELLRQNGASRARLEILPGDHEFSESQDQLVRLILEWMNTTEQGGVSWK
jgi:uncharacterized protein